MVCVVLEIFIIIMFIGLVFAENEVAWVARCSHSCEGSLLVDAEADISESVHICAGADVGTSEVRPASFNVEVNDGREYFLEVVKLPEEEVVLEEPLAHAIVADIAKDMREV